MNENQISKEIVDACYKIHTTMGPGLFESIYEELLSYELDKRGLSYERQKGIPLIYEDVKMEIGFRADLIVEKKVIVEIKSVEFVGPVHFKQVLSYLRLSDLKLGLLVNFGSAYIKDGIKRVVNGL